MPFTLTPQVDDSVYRVNLTLEDQIGERVRKLFRLNNAAGTEGVEEAMQALEALSDAALVNASASLTAEVTGASTAKGTSGDFSYVSQQLVLTFSRGHPLNANKTILSTYVIPAPVDTIRNGTQIVLGDDPVSYGAAADATETLTHLINYLEDNLVYEDITDDITVGGWTFEPDRSGFISTARIQEGVPNS